MRVTPSIPAISLVMAIALVSPALGSHICAALPPYSLTNAVQQHPELQQAYDTVKANAVATWYTDRGWPSQIPDLLAQCQGDIPSIVIYGLPDKDCGDGGFSQSGDNKNADMYRTWIQTLVGQVGQRQVIYVLEPDAVGLVAAGGCGVQKGYLQNLKVAVGLLASNANAHIYVDVASWADQNQAVNVLVELKTAGRLKRNRHQHCQLPPYQRVKRLVPIVLDGDGWVALCLGRVAQFQRLAPERMVQCSVGGDGVAPHRRYQPSFGESDGECTGRSSDAMVGPAAGQFFFDGFKSLWNQGYYVVTMGLPKIREGGVSKSYTAPSSSTSPSHPSKDSPEPTYEGVKLYAQCGGLRYTGATKCKQGLDCHRWNEWYSQCISPDVGRIPAKTSVVTSPESTNFTDPPITLHQVPAWHPCGGVNYTSPTECLDGYECKSTDDDLSQCVEQVVAADQRIAAWQQCGGVDYYGSSTCVSGFVCKPTDDNYSQCVAIATPTSVAKNPASHRQSELRVPA
ncbi:hypothetical protein H257_11272 [Aphanomyces astaci]|uniref:CBM1 domain-containing protein n=1 Tax=Aphanomyces astaci TaxID=112090 RepID=W4G2P2_APHAT|nr:hypothetical protein H257_11272 [Aphanomyces astaci]ETV73955.1 hypothetical protein H257_11272 [Aphanomyces astaci]|eukprot:XP_009836468.1 hypothetical protein H257_11272 [Aphanomyces astaci]